VDVARCRSMSVQVKSGSLCTKTALGCDTPPMLQVSVVIVFVPQTPGRPVTDGRLRPLTGATHVFGIPHTPRRRLGCARPSHLPVGVAPGPAVPCGKAKREAERACPEKEAARENGDGRTAQGAGDRDRAVTDSGFRSGTRRAKETEHPTGSGAGGGGSPGAPRGRSRVPAPQPVRAAVPHGRLASHIAPSGEVVS